MKNLTNKYLKIAEDTIDEGYTQKELDRIDPNAPTVNIQVRDSDGNKTKWLGMNNKAGLMALKKFIEARILAVGQVPSKRFPPVR